MKGQDNHSRSLILSALLALSLTACGGGGGGDGDGKQKIDPFTFTPVNNAAPGKMIFSDEVTLSGFTDELEITTEGGAWCLRPSDENTQTCSETPGAVNPGDRLSLRVISGEEVDDEVSVSVTISGDGGPSYSTTFTVRTADVSPDAFSFSSGDVNSADPGSVHVFTSTELAGFEGQILAQLTGDPNATFGIIREGTTGEPSSKPKMVETGDKLEVHITAPEEIGQTETANVTVGQGEQARTVKINVTTGDNVAPEFTIDFPTAKSVTQAETITLTGRYTENHLPGSIIAFNQIGSQIEGIVRDDGHWQMTVDLEVGQNILELEMTDSVGHRSTHRSVEIQRDADFFSQGVRAIAHDQDDNIVYALDRTHTSRIISIDLNTRARRVISDDSTGSGPQFDKETDLLLDEINNRLITWSCHDLCGLLSIDISTGARTELTTGLVPSEDVGGLTFGRNGTILFVAEMDDSPGDAALVEFDPSNPESLRIVSRFSNDATKQVGAGTARLDHALDLDFHDSGTGVVYVLTYHDRGFSNDLRRVVSVQYDGGSREIVSENNQVGAFGLDKPSDLEVHQASGMVYVADKGADTNGLGVVHTRPIFRINPADGSREVVIRNEITPTVDLNQPEDMILVPTSGGLEVWVADLSKRGIPRFRLGSSLDDGHVPESIAVGSGADFDAPFRLELDADNDRLLVLSEKSLQTVGISDGLRSERIYQVPSGADMRFGGLHLAEDQLWLTTNGGFRGVATVDRASLGSDSVLLQQRFTDLASDLGTSSDLLVEGTLDDAVVYLATDFDTDGGDFIKKIEFTDGNASGISSVIELADFDENPTISRYAPHQMIVSSSGVQLLDAMSESLLFEDDMVSSTLTFDESRRYLYRMDSIDLYRHDWQIPGEPGDQLFLVGDRWPLPGTQNDPSDLGSIVIDTERNRLYGLLDDGHNVVAINVTDILRDADGEPARTPEDVDPDANPRPSGEAVLISRSENLSDSI